MAIAWQRATLDPVGPCHLSAARYTFDPNQSGEPGGVRVAGWWVRVVSQQTLFSEHPSSLPLIQPLGENFFKNVALL